MGFLASQKTNEEIEIMGAVGEEGGEKEGGREGWTGAGQEREADF